MSNLPFVVVAMSGGVDSSVAAALLVEQGYPVTGIMLRLWSEPGSECDNRCCTPEAVSDARRVAAHLNIPFYVIDTASLFRQEIVQYFLDDYAQGYTPNPCLLCNRKIRWGFLLEQTLSMGAKYLATGHYARLRHTSSGQIELLRAKDLKKDQSYVLSTLNQSQLAHTLLPLGEYQKDEVRTLAKNYGLSVAAKKDSQDLCFLANEDYRSFLTRYIPSLLQPGPVVDSHGKKIAEHQGLAFYTIGQRKGINFAAGHPLYVLAKEIHSNTLVVGTQDELGNDRAKITQLNWILENPPAKTFRAQVKIRYKAELAWAELSVQANESVIAIFEHPLRDITPGQTAVIYQDDQVLGSGIIQIESGI